MSATFSVDYTNWDWLPDAAKEIESYVLRLLAESGIQPHVVAARAKSIASFQRKQSAKNYENPMGQITDIAAIRIITYSNTDRDRVRELIRSRFTVLNGEDRNPGDEKPSRFRGYDCLHIVVSGESEDQNSDWLVSGGKLERYFQTFSGLEVQIRTVAGHAWAEFEHARRYKGALYDAISEQDKETVDQLFGAASDARRALDETFVAIDRILARPTVERDSSIVESNAEEIAALDSGNATTITPESLSQFLESRFPKDSAGSEKGVRFGVELAEGVNIHTIEALESTLEDVDSEQVRALMDSGVPVTRVRRLDDELLAHFGQGYIDATKNAGGVNHRPLQLEARYDRLRGKTRYRTYLLLGSEVPPGLEAGPYTAIGALREVARILAKRRGAEAVLTAGYITDEPALSTGARAKRVDLNDQEAIWVSSNLSREDSEQLMDELVSRSRPVDLQVSRGDVVIADGKTEDPQEREYEH